MNTVLEPFPRLGVVLIHKMLETKRYGILPGLDVTQRCHVLLLGRCGLSEYTASGLAHLDVIGLR